MAFNDCMVEQFEKAKVSKDQRDALLKRYENTFKKAYEVDGLSKVEAERLAQNDVELMIKNKEETSRNKVRALLKQKEIDRKLDDITDVRIETKVAKLYQQAAHRGEGVTASALAFFRDEIKKISPNFFETSRDYKLFNEALRKAFNNDFTGEAGMIAKAIANTNEYNRLRFVNAGGIMGKVDNYTVPQVHSKESLMAVKKKIQNDLGVDANVAHKKLKETWLKEASENFDILDDAGRKLDLAEKLKALDNTFEDIMTDGLHSQRLRFEKGEELGFGTGDIDQRRNKRRVLQPKSYEAFESYNNKYGVGEQGLPALFFNHVQSMSRDIGMLEVLGPRPTSMARHLDNKMKLEGESAVTRSRVNADFRVLKGIARSGSADSTGWKVLTGLLNLQRSALLGGASISAISDVAFGAATAKINGMSASRALSMYSKKLFTSGGELTTIANRSGFITDVVNGSILQDTRFAGDLGRDTTLAWLAGATNKFSGLARMTEAMKDAISLEFMASVAEQLNTKIPFNDLDPDFKKMLVRGGIDQSDWDVLAKADFFEADNGSKFLISNDLRVSDKIDAQISNSIANKLDDIIFTLRQQATNEATLATKSITGGAIFGDGSAGSMSKAFASSIFMFKTFPITVMNTHLLPALHRAGIPEALSKVRNRDLRGAADAFNVKGLDHLGFALIGTTILGGLAMQLKGLIQGKTLQDSNKKEFWIAAMMQGGGLGLMSDFVLSDYSRFGRDPIADGLGGPMVGLTSDLFRATKGNFDRTLADKDPNFKRDMFKVLKRSIPMGSLWYLRLGLDRMLLDRVEKVLDPKFDQRIRKQEKIMMKERGQQFWSKPTGE